MRSFVPSRVVVVSRSATFRRTRGRKARAPIASRLRRIVVSVSDRPTISVVVSNGTLISASVRWPGRPTLQREWDDVTRRIFVAADVVFILVAWSATRALIFAALFLTAHAAGNPLTNWDGEWYQRIATVGYEYSPDGRQHDVAFFPLYPLTVAALMRVVPLPFGIAAPLVDNLAFLLALGSLFAWLSRRCDRATARWSVAT